MPTTIHLIRHAQGYHNLYQDTSIRDPDLTPLGIAQSRDLGAIFPHKEKITHIVASPMRRTLFTAYYAFQDLLLAPSTDNDGAAAAAAAAPDDKHHSGNRKVKKIIANPDFQECSEAPCDVGTDPEALAREFGATSSFPVVDLGLVADGWNDKAAAGGSRYAADALALDRRARAARRWLRDLASDDEARGEGDAVIVVVTHGDFIQVLNQEPGILWKNTEYHTYEFMHPDGDDEDAFLREVQQPVQVGTTF